MTDDTEETQALEAEASRGESARQVLANDIYQQSWKVLEDAALEALIDCDKSDDAGRYRLSETIKTLRKTRQIVEQIMETGQGAARALREIRLGRKPFF